ncbi:glycosyltransferase family 2 protein [Winogradskyella sp. DF17]|jgi:glycosyltransferase involved in cell wall biosynthesis|uniref:Glycosyltransferase family 2 protein n=1 Tax=Winogradskyella pelagia TaxID=2819984 RepID=A0ABS3T2P6_9FLAO|nr:glycosyltransferase family 2 protein [Winogradskyella sp. DF17]MBO3116719.1 glycosyltransferase family 2 protein [Winogradskyella sp. DF17]
MDFNGRKYRLTIIVPVNNEEENLPRLATELFNYLKIAVVPTQVLFVNDGSTDNSEALIASICKNNNSFNYISLRTNGGLSTALKAGFDIIETELTGYIDADLQTLPRDFNILLKHIDSNDLVMGFRQKRKDAFLKYLSSILANKFRRIFTRDGINDTGCPLKIIKTDFAKQLPLFKGMHRFLPALIQLQKGRVMQVPIEHYPRVFGKSHFNLPNRVLGTFIDCFIFLWIKKRFITYDISNSNTKPE